VRKVTGASAMDSFRNPTHGKERCARQAFFKQIRASALRTCQFSLVLSDANGKIYKPARW
jgi:hypothetical protein